jgi:RNA polymerase sigma-70 factor (ECF subfamily)
VVRSTRKSSQLAKHLSTGDSHFVPVAEILAAARAAWPGVELDAEIFATYVAKRADGDGDLAELRTSDLYLACACLESIPEALSAFETAFLARIDPHLRRYDPSPAFADEVRAILRERFFVWKNGDPPRIAGYSGRGALGAWVRVAAVRVALRLSTRGAQPVALDTAVHADPEIDYVRTHYRSAFGTALAEGLRTLDADERKLLRLHFVEGLTIDGLAPIYQIHRATAARRLADARERLLRATRRHIANSLGIDGRELDSLLALVRSRIEIDVSAVFRSQ